MTFLILLAGTILVRTAAIAQHAYNLLLQPSIILEAPGYLIAAAGNPDGSHAAYAIENPKLIEHHFAEAVADSTPNAVFPAKRERPLQIGSEKVRKKVALRRRNRERNAFAFDRPWGMWW
jgi:hypothetical protein